MIDSELPPHNPEAEQVALGICLLEPSLITWFSERGVSEMFYDLRNQKIFNALLRMMDKGIIPDTASLYQELKNDNIEAYYISGLMGMVDSVFNKEYWFNILRELFISRKVVKLGIELQQDQTNFLSRIAEFQKQIVNTKSEFQDRRTQFKEVVSYIQEAFESKGACLGLRTGYQDLDFIIGGMAPGDMIVLAGRPGMGKSTLALNILENIAMDQKIQGGFISMEMSPVQLNLRTVARFSRIPTNTLSEGELDEKDFFKLRDWVGKLSSIPLEIQRPKQSDIQSVRMLARKMKMEKNIKILVIDYIQRISGTRRFENKNTEITEVSNGIKDMAVELDLPVIALCQLNRGVEKENRRPRLSDFRDSGSIEQDADKAVLIYCENELTEIDGGTPVTMIVAKNRGGRLGECNLLFKKNLTMYENHSKLLTQTRY